MLKLIINFLLILSSVWADISDNEIESNSIDLAFLNDAKETENWAYEHNEIDPEIISIFDKNYGKTKEAVFEFSTENAKEVASVFHGSENYEQQAKTNSSGTVKFFERNSTDTSTENFEDLEYSTTESQDKNFKIVSNSDENEKLSTEDEVTNDDFEDFIDVSTEENQNENFKLSEDSSYTTIIPYVYINKKIPTSENIEITTENFKYFSTDIENFEENDDSTHTPEINPSTEGTTTENVQYFPTEEIFEETTTEVFENVYSINDVPKDIHLRYKSGENILEIFDHIDNNYQSVYYQIEGYFTLYKIISEDKSININNWNLKFAKFINATPKINQYISNRQYIELYKAIPKCALEFFSAKIIIQNRLYNENLVASEIMEDEIKRDVFFTNLTENGDNTNCVWYPEIFESKQGVSLLLKNKFYNETLFASRFISNYGDHIVYTSTAGQFTEMSKWTVEPVDKDGEVCLLKNTFFDEYLCAYDERFYQWTHYRRLFTKIGGLPDDLSCHFTYHNADNL